MSLSTIIRSREQADRHSARLAVGAVLSMALHGLLLLLEFGIPGLGLPGMAMPWDEQRAQSVALSVQLTAAQRAIVLPAIPTPPVPDMATFRPGFPVERRIEAAPLPSAPHPRARATLHMIPERAAPHMKKNVKSSPASKRKRSRSPARKPVTPKQEVQQAQAKPITQMTDADNAFAVMPPDPDVPAQHASDTFEPPQQLAEAMLPPVNDIAVPLLPEPLPPDTQPIETPMLPEPLMPALVEAQPVDQHPVTATNVATAREIDIDDEAAKRDALAQEALKQAVQQERMEQEAHQAAQQAAALALQQRQQAEQEQIQQELAQRARALEEDRLAQLRKQEQQQREVLELAARIRADEEARQHAELERKRSEELVARTHEQELAARQKATQAAAQQREQARVTHQAARAAAPNGAGQRPDNDRPAPLARGLYGSDLASRALEQAKRSELLRVDPRDARPMLNDTESSHRRSVFGSIDRNVELTLYIDSWRAKIERNGSLNYAQSDKDKARGDPVVTVAIRSDGNIDDVVINRSSGQPQLDEAVRRIVKLNARYAAFPPALARKYDVIEIRRIWNFDGTLRILEEVR